MATNGTASDDTYMADPYANSGKLDTGSLGPAFGGGGGGLFLPANPVPAAQPDFLFPENYEESYRRSWGERLTFHIGASYLAGKWPPCAA